MPILNKADELWGIPDDTAYENVTVPEWIVNGEPVTVRLRSISAAERDQYEQSTYKIVNGKAVPDVVNSRARLVAMSIVDENGKAVFKANKGSTDVLRLGQRNAKILDRLFEHAAALSGIDVDGSGDDKDEETDAVFGNAQSDGSTSA